MKKHEKPGGMLDYTIAVLMIMILILATFLMPQMFSAVVDEKDLNQVHAVERESFSFETLVDMTVGERVQQVMVVINNKNSVRRTLALNDGEVLDRNLYDGLKEAIGIAVLHKLMPDISAYDIESNIVYAEYYNLSDGATENAETGFWTLRFSDYETFDFTFRVDATEYIIYQAELYCAEVTEYIAQITSDDKEVVEFLNNQFMDGCGAYYEAEGYGPLTDLTYGDMVFLMGFERGEYGFYHSPCENASFAAMGIRWGFVPITIALENGSSIKEWGYKGIVDYYKNLYGIDIESAQEHQ